jgi:hypothetical protein
MKTHDDVFQEMLEFLWSTVDIKKKLLEEDIEKYEAAEDLFSIHPEPKLYIVSSQDK